MPKPDHAVAIHRSPRFRESATSIGCPAPGHLDEGRASGSSRATPVDRTGERAGLDRARRRWRDLVQRALPAAAADHSDWPIRIDHCFARVILDAVCGQPWREVIAAPAWRHMDAAMLDAASGLALAMIDGSADLHALDAQSLVWRGKAPRRR